MWSQDRFLEAWNFAAEAHAGQTVPGSSRAYINHVGSVAMEIMAAIARRGDVADPDLAVQCALLHDVVEDTGIREEEIRRRFGDAVANGVAALTKRPELGSKGEQMRDSLLRIRVQPREVWMVKLADRITNLQPPPERWSPTRRARYRDQAREILDQLGAACPILSGRLREKIERYDSYL